METKPVAYLHWARLGQRWVAYDAGGHVIARDIHKDVVVAVCEQFGYRVVEVEGG
jgi:hypothetical protein